jgi:anthranilate phosphoribosyltransferase
VLRSGEKNAARAAVVVNAAAAIHVADRVADLAQGVAAAEAAIDSGAALQAFERLRDATARIVR